MDERSPLLPPSKKKGVTETSFVKAPPTLTGRLPADRSDAATQTSENPSPGDHTLSVQEVTYVVKETVGAWYKGACFREERKKTVLNGVNLHLVSGQITAILGNSGSGKTSLLDVISRRTPWSAELTGDVFFNQSRVTQSLMQEHASYVMQSDRLLPNLTVQETLTYIAHLKFASNISGFSIKQQVMRVINEMGLRHVMTSRIGGHMNRSLSGGEKRRVTIAIQLLQDPKIVLLDEPTSGLDSFTAHHLVESLASLARKNKIVLLTIHQPRSDIFKLFDNITILSLGNLVYFGPASEMVSYFSYIGHPCPMTANPLDHFVDLASIDRRDLNKRRNTMLKVSDLVNQYKTSELYHSCLGRIENALLQESYNEDGDCGDYTDVTGAIMNTYALTYSRKSPSWISKTFRLTMRLMVNLYRDRPEFLMRFQFTLFSVFLLLFIGRLKHNLNSVQDRIGLMYEAVQIPMAVGNYQCIALLPVLRDLFYRESRDGLYSASSFVMSFTFFILIMDFITTFLFCSIAYWSIGFYPTGDRFGIYVAVVFILMIDGELLTLTVLAYVENTRIACGAVMLYLTASGLIASGFIKTLTSMFVGLQDLSWVMIHKYCSEIVVVNEFKDLKFKCGTGTTCPFDGNQYLKTYYPDAEDNMVRNFLCMIGMTLGLCLIAILSYKIRGVPNLN
ncbi:ATP-binding cassette sub-family G member 5-like [Tubulanus polymorphus]|uniref:ATP-binding cassette sub-family G member 5-like n=1 Tax=Tubulanus polymorphus TaxID=672921 RepID=UPI003DA249D9